MIIKQFLFIICSCISITLFAQDNPNFSSNEPPDSSANARTIDELADEKNALKSAILPGWGQFKNKQYPKSAFFLAAVGTGIALSIDRGNDFQMYDNPYNSFVTNTSSQNFSLEELIQLEQDRADALGRRDFMRGATAYVYVMNIADAAAQYKILRQDPEKHSATKAAYYSAILPGLGQAYNKKYWKIPIVYAALGTSIYIANENRKTHRNYEREIEFRNVEGQEFSTGFRTALSQSQLEANLDTWRQYRDIAYVSTAVIYLLNILDATVDAHLYDFNVDEDLSFNVDPVFDRMNDQIYYGLQFTFPIASKR